jgi:hypothetical protein
MATLRERILAFVREHPGMTDREITDALLVPGAPQQSVNQTCRALEASHHLSRKPRGDGKIGNFLGDTQETLVVANRSIPIFQQLDPLSEDRLKEGLRAWLEHAGWAVEIADGRTHGIDVRATRNGASWIIEVKGRGSSQPMRVNYFIGILGELLQRMHDPGARYSIALPDLQQFRRLWERLPRLAKERTRISALFINEAGAIEEQP